MTAPSEDAVSVTRGEPRSRTELVLEAIAGPNRRLEKGRGHSEQIPFY